jgi:hypothetical protein
VTCPRCVPYSSAGSQLQPLGINMFANTTFAAPAVVPYHCHTVKTPGCPALGSVVGAYVLWLPCVVRCHLLLINAMCIP